MGNKHFLWHIKVDTPIHSLLLNRGNDTQQLNWEFSVSIGLPDVKISQHLQIDDGFRDAFDAVVVKVDRLQGGEQTHLWGDFCEAVLRQICNTGGETGVDETCFCFWKYIAHYSLPQRWPLCFRLLRLINTSLWQSDQQCASSSILV